VKDCWPGDRQVRLCCRRSRSNLYSGVPGSAATALFLAPSFYTGSRRPEFFQKGILSYTVFCGILLAQFTFFLSGLFLARYFAKVIRIPNSLLAPALQRSVSWGLMLRKAISMMSS